MRRRALLLVLAAAGAAQGAPPDGRLALTGKRPRIEKIDTGFSAVEADPPELLRAELLPTGELLLEPKAAGVARVFLYATRLVRVLEVALDMPLPPPPTEPPPAACTDQGEARVASAACYDYWRARLAHLPAADAPPISLEGDGLMAELKAAQAALAAAGLKLRVALSPFGLRVQGAKDEAEKHRALRLIWPFILGPLRLDE